MSRGRPTQPTVSRLQEQLEAAKLREQVIQRVSQIVGSSLDLSEVLDLALVEVERAFAPGCCGVKVVSEVATQLHANGLCRRDGKAFPIPPEASPVDECPHVQRAFDAGDVLLLPPCDRPCCCKSPPHEQGRPLVVAPIAFGHMRLGAICLHQGSEPWTDARRDLLMVMARQVGLAIRTAWLFGQVERSTLRLESTLAGTPIVVVSTHGIVELWSQAATHTFGYGPEQALGRGLADLWRVPDPEELAQHIARAADGQAGAFEAAAWADGDRQLAISVSASPVRDRDGRVDEVLLVVQDVTDVQHELHLTKSFLRSALDGIRDFISIVDRDYRIVFANRAACARAGLPQEELCGKKCHSAYWSLKQPCPHCMTDVTFADGQPHHAVFDVAGDDGATEWLETWTYPILDPSGTAEYVIEYCRDVTEQRSQRRQLGRKVHELRQAYQQVASLNSQLLHAEKMASIGQMAASLAHQIDSPLSTIFGYAGMLAKHIAGERQREWLETIGEQAEVCRKSLRNLLDFSRKATFGRSRVDLNHVVGRVISLMEYVLRVRGIEVELHLDSAAPPVWGNEDELQQLLFNLVGNASDAMPKGGKLRIDTAPAEGGKFIDVTVTDTGMGIPPENIERIFEPFFTTKERGQGTGLGLAVCQDIVRSHRGTISVESPVRGRPSESAKGAVFRARLPAASDAAEPRARP